MEGIALIRPQYFFTGDKLKIMGIDEAGRGPVLGPMVMVGFMLDEELLPELKKMGVKDSKLLKPEVREILDVKLRKIGKPFIRVIGPRQIDGFNLNRLEKMATRDIILEGSPNKVIIDAFENNLERKLNLPKVKIIAEHKADLKYEIVGAASIIAKVLRDKRIKEIQKEYGDIGSGYPGDPKTAKFVQEIVKSKKELPPFVRKSWGTIKRITEQEAQTALTGFL